MALNDLLIKVNIPSIDCKGIYFKDIGNIFKNKKELNKKDLDKIKYNYIVIVLKLWFRSKTTKRTLKFNDITGLAAVKKASIIRNELKDELESTGTLAKRDFKTLNELYKNYMIFKGTSLSTNTIYTNKKTYDKWIKEEIGDMEISKVTTFDIQPIVNRMLKEGKAPRTAQSIKQILRPIFNHAIDLEICDKNPAIKVNIPKFDNTVHFDLTDEKRKILYKEMKEYKHLKFRGIMLFLYEARRLNEVLTLKWENIFFDQKLYTVEYTHSKIRKQQTYRLSKTVEEFLILFGRHKRGYIFPGETTKHVTSSTFRNHWEKLLENAGIDKMRIHDTRHLYGTTLVNQGISKEIIAKQMGHSSTNVTARYSKVNIDTAEIGLNSYLEN